MTGGDGKSGPANNNNSEHQAEAAYFAAFTHWTVYDYPKAIDYFVRSIKAEEKTTPPIWGKKAWEYAILLLKMLPVETKAETAIEWANRLEAVARPLKSDAYAEMKVKMIELQKRLVLDKQAEILDNEADVVKAQRDWGAYRKKLTEVVELKHSRKHYLDAINLAVLLTKQQPALGVSDAEVNAAYDAAIQAIDGMPYMTLPTKETWTKALRKSVGK